MEIWIDGILTFAVNDAASISTNWIVPASGAHKIRFRTTNTDGFTTENVVVIFAGTTSVPGGITSGLNVWLKSESGITQNAKGFVSQWSDSSGHANHATQAVDANKPVYAQKVFGEMPGLIFNGNFLSSTTGMPAGSYTKIVRVLISDAGSGNIVSTSTNTPTMNALYVGNASPQLVHDYQFFATSPTAMPVGQSSLVDATYDASTNVGKLYLNGASVATGTANSDSTNPSYELGALNQGNTLRGAIGEVLIYNRVLADSERAAVESALNAKMALPADAPRLTYAAWANAHISVGQDATPGGDANHNGVTNFVEFALGLNPTAPGIPGILDVQSSAGLVAVTYRRPTDRTGVSYQLYESSDLQQWTAVSDYAGPASNGIEERQYTRPLSSAIRAFYKLTISSSP
jgi:hypothetical protein